MLEHIYYIYYFHAIYNHSSKKSFSLPGHMILSHEYPKWVIPFCAHIFFFREIFCPIISYE